MMKMLIEMLLHIIKYKFDKDNNIQLGGIWQNKLITGLVRSLFVDYYLIKYNSITCSTVSNKYGKPFLQSLAKQFIEQGKSVKIILKDKEFPYEINDQESYWKSSNGIMASEKLIKFEK